MLMGVKKFSKEVVKIGEKKRLNYEKCSYFAMMEGKKT